MYIVEVEERRNWKREVDDPEALIKFEYYCYQSDDVNPVARVKETRATRVLLLRQHPSHQEGGESEWDGTEDVNGCVGGNNRLFKRYYR